MDLLAQLNRAMEYIEEHISDNIALEDISSATSYSAYHFGRMFYYIAGTPLSEYVRKRKLSLAAADMQDKGYRIIDVAVKYGYDSADSFTRAFVRQHGVTPSAARQQGVSLKIYPPLVFHIKIEGAQEMNWRIEKTEAVEVFGIERMFKEEDLDKVPNFWAECQENGSYEKLFDDALGVRGQKGQCVINAICGHIEPGSKDCFYMLYAVKTDGCKTEGYKQSVIPENTWAVFREEGMINHDDCKIPQLFRRAYSEWLPSSGYEKGAGPDLEIYGDDFEEVWLPVVKR